MALQVKIHQVVVLNFTDHYTRHSLQNPKESKRIVGVIYGTLIGRIINILGSFQAKATISSKTNEIEQLDLKYINEKMQLLKQANFYKDCELLGWYSSAPDLKPFSKDISFHKEFNVLNENPIYVCFDPLKQIKGYDLPLKVFETKLIQQDKTQVETLSELSYEIDSIKAEILSIEHLSKNMASADTSLFADNMSNSVNSLQILEEKIQYLINYVEKNPKAKENFEILRELKEVCINFPDKMEKNYREELIEEYKETSLVNLMTALLVANKTVQDVTHLRPNFDVKTTKAYEDI